jgi:hypothetical protein
VQGKSHKQNILCTVWCWHVSGTLVCFARNVINRTCERLDSEKDTILKIILKRNDSE